jgi:hypothetical protein
MKTLTVILEYCGGSRTDKLFEQMRSWNPGRTIDVLDNASPSNRCNCITQQNAENTYIGGGITDCLRLAEARSCENLFFLVNDIEPTTPIVVDQFEQALAQNPTLVQVAAAVTRDSTPHSAYYPWMLAHPSNNLRRVPHSDLLCCIVRTPFIRSFNGFPPSRGGFGYDWELAYQALLGGLQIAIADWCVVRHEDKIIAEGEAAGSKRSKEDEMINVYKNRYPHSEFAIIHTIAEYWRRGVIQFG